MDSETKEKSPLERKLESILTIDGQGRPKKARELLVLLYDYPKLEVMEALTEIGNRKYF